MKKYKKLPLILAVFMLFLLLLSACAKQQSKRAVVLFTNDVHFHYDGYPVLAAYRETLLEQGENVLLLDAGDVTQGGFLANMNNGAPAIPLLNAVHYDFVVPGNHDYDFGDEALRANIEASEFPWVACNSDTIADAFIPYYLADLAGHKIAFVGVTAKDDYPMNAEQVPLAIENAKKDGAEAVIIVAHTGEETEKFLQTLTGVDLYINAHDHMLYDDGENALFLPDKDGKLIQVLETGSGFANIGKLTLDFSKPEIDFSTEMIATSSLAAQQEEGLSERAAKARDSILEIIDAYAQETAEWEIPIGTSECLVHTYDPAKRPEYNDLLETNGGNFTADAIRSVTGADIGIINGTTLRDAIEEGVVTRLDLYNFLPFSEPICTVKMTGAQILDILEIGTRNWPEYTHAAPSVSGMTFKVRISAAPTAQMDGDKYLGPMPGTERRVFDVRIGGEPIVPEKEYTVGSSAYFLFNRYNTVVTEKEENCPTFGTPVEVLEKYITQDLGGVIPKALYGNIPGDGRIGFE